MIRLPLALPSILLAAALLAGCEPDGGGSLRVAVIGERPAMADPAAGPLAAPDAVLLANSAQGLVRFDARGQIVPGLAERWNVTDDGLSYIFRLSPEEWNGGGKVNARQVARALNTSLARVSRSALKDSAGAISDVVAMTDRVIEIRLTAPRPNLLQLLAQPEFAILRDGEGTGPFRIDDRGGDGPIRLRRSIADLDSGESRNEEVLLEGLEAERAVAAFRDGAVDLVLGGTFVDLPLAKVDGLPRDSLRFDPSAGLFGLAPARGGGPVGNAEVRRLLSRAIDRSALVEALDVPALLPRATLLEPGLDGMGDPAAPEWAATPPSTRTEELRSQFETLFAANGWPMRLTLRLPEGPGASLLFERIAADLAAVGIILERAAKRAPADLRLIDQVAPSSSAAWYLRKFRCEEAPACLEAADVLLEAARAAPVAAQRYALLGEAARLMDEAQLFIPIAAPIRWSLVSNRAQGFAGNRFARHTLTELGTKLSRERAD